MDSIDKLLQYIDLCIVVLLVLGVVIAAFLVKSIVSLFIKVVKFIKVKSSWKFLISNYDNVTLYCLGRVVNKGKINIVALNNSDWNIKVKKKTSEVYLNPVNISIVVNGENDSYLEILPLLKEEDIVFTL